MLSQLVRQYWHRVQSGGKPEWNELFFIGRQGNRITLVELRESIRFTNVHGVTTIWGMSGEVGSRFHVVSNPRSPFHQTLTSDSFHLPATLCDL